VGKIELFGGPSARQEKRGKGKTRGRAGTLKVREEETLLIIRGGERGEGETKGPESGEINTLRGKGCAMTARKKKVVSFWVDGDVPGYREITTETSSYDKKEFPSPGTKGSQVRSTQQGEDTFERCRKGVKGEFDRLCLPPQQRDRGCVG